VFDHVILLINGQVADIVVQWAVSADVSGLMTSHDSGVRFVIFVQSMGLGRLRGGMCEGLCVVAGMAGAGALDQRKEKVNRVGIELVVKLWLGILTSNEKPHWPGDLGQTFMQPEANPVDCYPLVDLYQTL
jgi:hypothetical protein